MGERVRLVPYFTVEIELELVFDDAVSIDLGAIGASFRTSCSKLRVLAWVEAGKSDAIDAATPISARTRRPAIVRG